MRVMKFGGSSVANAQRIKDVVRIVQDSKKELEQIVVVCSALQGVTDLLIDTAKRAGRADESYLEQFREIKNRHVQCTYELFIDESRVEVKQQMETLFQSLHDVLLGMFLLKECSIRSLDFVASFGERLSNYFVCAYMQTISLNACFLDTRRVIKTDDCFLNARVNMPETFCLIQDFSRSENASVFVVTGFIGSTESGETTTLGRGGSDYTASIFGAALGVDEIEIWTDVSGVLTADPRKVFSATPIDEMTYEEAAEMAYFGAKVIYPPTMQPAMEAGIPIRIKNTFAPQDTGTLIHAFVSEEGRSRVTGISSIDDISLIRISGSGMIGVSGIAARLFQTLASEKISAILISQGSSEHSICVAITPSDANRAIRVLREAFDREFALHQVDDIRVDTDLSVIAVIGERMRQTPGISGMIFSALGNAHVNVVAVAQGSNERNISIVVSKEDVQRGVQAIHEACFVSHDTIDLFLVGKGKIGGMLLDQIQALSSSNIRVQGIQTQNKDRTLAEFVDLAKAHIGQRKVFVDCTASDEPVLFYESLMQGNVSVVVANKRGLCGSFSNYRQIMNSSSTFLYETTVGAGLPVIKTIKSLLETGDRIEAICGVFSGTLSYLFNGYNGTESFADRVRLAKEK
ncbi:MAG: aspartate kinase, partial [Patescibacteria group bacterium]